LTSAASGLTSASSRRREVVWLSEAHGRG